AHLVLLGADLGVEVVAVAAAAVRVGIAVAVGVARHLIAAVELFVAGVDGAGLAVAAAHRLAQAAADLQVAQLEAVAVLVVLALAVVGGEAAAIDVGIAAIEGARDAVVALRVDGAGAADGRIGVGTGVEGHAPALPRRAAAPRRIEGARGGGRAARAEQLGGAGAERGRREQRGGKARSGGRRAGHTCDGSLEHPRAGAVRAGRAPSSARAAT